MQLFNAQDELTDPPQSALQADLTPRANRRHPRARTSARKGTGVRVIESNVKSELSPAGSNRFRCQYRRWITTREESFRHSSWANRRVKILRGMEHAGYPHGRIERFVNCGSFARVMEDADTGDKHVSGSFCHDRFCQVCMRSKALLIAANLEEKIKSDDRPYLHIVLTMKHNAQELPAQVDRLYKSFRTLRARPLFKHSISGGAAFLQIHVSETDGLWHVHLHILAQGVFLDVYLLSKEWLSITGDSSNVHVTKVFNAQKAIREVTRYAAKPVDGNTTNNPDHLAELMRAITGRRVCYSFGSWRGFKLTAKPPKDPELRLVDQGSLDSWIVRAEGGELHAQHVLELMMKRSNPKTGPPDLTAPAWRQPIA